MAFGDYQIEIYLQGLAGNVPSLPMAFADWETTARSAPPPSVYACGLALGGVDGYPTLKDLTAPTPRSPKSMRAPTRSSGS